MMPHLGVLAQVHPQAALEVFERDCLIYLGTCVAAKGTGKPGKPCFRYTVRSATLNESGEMTVRRPPPVSARRRRDGHRGGRARARLRRRRRSGQADRARGARRHGRPHPRCARPAAASCQQTATTGRALVDAVGHRAAVCIRSSSATDCGHDATAWRQPTPRTQGRRARMRYTVRDGCCRSPATCW